MSSSTAKPTSPQRRPWTIEEIKEFLAGAAAPDLGMKDRKGLNALHYAVLKSATAADDLRPLLELLQPSEGEESQIQLLLDLFERVAESQARVEARLAAIESMLAGRTVPWPAPSRPVEIVLSS